MKLQWYELTISGKNMKSKCFSLPKNMPIPNEGDVIHISGWCARVTQVSFHIPNKKLIGVSIRGEFPL